MRTLLEICVDTPFDARSAIEGGADRIELCAALALGGLTPTPGTADIAVGLGACVHAMIRPRAGDFVYDGDELAVMCTDIVELAKRGVQGFVVGALTPENTLDYEILSRLRSAARESRCILHRAVDLTPDPVAATRMAIDIGIDGILTSGGAAAAGDGLATIARMVEAGGEHLAIMAGSGIRPDNVATIIRATGVSQVHSSASVMRDWGDRRIVEMGFADGPRKIARAEQVRQLRQAIERG